jgi:sporulation protein YlmC with PRC-barrel domain
MPEHDLETLLGWRGRTVVDRKGERLGKVGDLYLDETTDLPAYASVRTGLFGRHESIVPLAGIREEDDDLIVPYDAELVRDAPALDPEAALDDAEAQRLARHYETGVSTPAPTNSTEMVRSEEEVVTGTTEPRPTERVRIRKVLVTDHVTRKVPVRREEIRLETDPPPKGEIERVDDVSD